jgi:Na+-driven multidrug efflux pump
MFIANGVLRGAGDTLIPMFITLMGLWIIRIPVAYFLSRHIGINGIWWGVPAAWFVGSLLSTLYYLTGRWKRKVIVKPQTIPIDIEN